MDCIMLHICRVYDFYLKWLRVIIDNQKVFSSFKFAFPVFLIMNNIKRNPKHLYITNSHTTAFLNSSHLIYIYMHTSAFLENRRVINASSCSDGAAFVLNDDDARK